MTVYLNLKLYKSELMFFPFISEAVTDTSKGNTNEERVSNKCCVELFA